MKWEETNGAQLVAPLSVVRLPGGPFLADVRGDYLRAVSNGERVAFDTVRSALYFTGLAWAYAQKAQGPAPRAGALADASPFTVCQVLEAAGIWGHLTADRRDVAAEAVPLLEVLLKSATARRRTPVEVLVLDLLEDARKRREQAPAAELVEELQRSAAHARALANEEAETQRVRNRMAPEALVGCYVEATEEDAWAALEHGWMKPGKTDLQAAAIAASVKVGNFERLEAADWFHRYRDAVHAEEARVPRAHHVEVAQAFARVPRKIPAPGK